MHPDNIFTRRRFGLDSRVWITLLVAGLLSACLLGFRAATNVPCSPIELKVEGFSTGRENSFYLGEKITFRAKMKGGKEVVWDFGDGTAPATGKSVIHEFNNEGSYLVSAVVNGKCMESVTISIRQLTSAPVTVGLANPDNPISGPEAPTAGTPVVFTASGSASAWEWMVLNAPDFPVQNGQAATFVFPTPGTRIIQLKLDNDPDKVFRKTVQVLPAPVSATSTELLPPPATAGAPVPVPTGKPEVEAPEKPKVVVIPDEEFRSMLDQATEGKKDAQTFYQYLCNGATTKVLVNGEDWKTFGDLYDEIHGKKRYDIRSVETVRDEQHCVTLLKVRMKKKNILGL